MKNILYAIYPKILGSGSGIEWILMEVIDTIRVDVILRLCGGLPFPRAISTHATSGRQMVTNTTDEIHAAFKESRFLDCRINAFPVGNAIASLVMIDLDRVNFETAQMLKDSLNHTIVNLTKDLPGAGPMVLFTGGGYHVYQPIDLPILEEESIFRFFDNPSTEFIRYAAQRWTNGKNDVCNKPSVKSCLLRVPGSINSKNNKIVEIVQEWNGKRLAANKLLYDFYINLASRKLADSRSPHHHNNNNNVNQYQISTSSRRSSRKITTTASASVVTTRQFEGISWIDSILGNEKGVSDYRKILVDLVIAPYLVNIKQCDFDDAYNKIMNWLHRCGQKRRLDFNARIKVRYALSRSKNNGIKPMRFDTMQSNYSDMYRKVVTTNDYNR